jgi:hypothetical protein
VGFGGDAALKTSHVVGERNDQYSTGTSDDDVENQYTIFESYDAQEIFPTFFPHELIDVLPAAQKSLVLLRAAQPDHPLLKAPVAHCVIRWFWTKTEIEAAWRGDKLDSELKELEVPILAEVIATSPSTNYKADLAQFRIFDLEPGSHFGQSSFNSKFTAASTSTLQAFVAAFPESLPPITPTLTHLTSLVFTPLVQHASSLSSTLLSLFLSHSANLNFQAHLQLLRSYLLLTSPLFKSRLTAALFSDSENCDLDNQSHTMSLRSLRQKSSKMAREHTRPWAVGLAPDLLLRETWPPVGADLSFFLRTVIVDSFESCYKESTEGVIQTGRERVLAEAEFRLGFAIRDLPVGPGRDKWLNPLCT